MSKNPAQPNSDPSTYGGEGGPPPEMLPGADWSKGIPTFPIPGSHPGPAPTPDDPSRVPGEGGYVDPGVGADWSKGPPWTPGTPQDPNDQGWDDPSRNGSG
jgi:hypothetical protein